MKVRRSGNKNAKKCWVLSTNIKSMSPGIMAKVEEELSTEIINERERACLRGWYTTVAR